MLALYLGEYQLCLPYVDLGKKIIARVEISTNTPVLPELKYQPTLM